MAAAIQVEISGHQGFQFQTAAPRQWRLMDVAKCGDVCVQILANGESCNWAQINVADSVNPAYRYMIRNRYGPLTHKISDNV